MRRSQCKVLHSSLFVIATVASSYGAGEGFFEAKAQPAIKPVSADHNATATLQEIVVLARKRPEQVLNLPEALTVIDGVTAERNGLARVEDIARLTPSLTIASTFRPGVVLITMRGISTAQGGEAPVAVVIDGVQMPSPDFINQELLDIDQIEVLRGPQGSLYGRNAIAGAINITTRKPGDHLTAWIKGSYGNNDHVRIAGSVSGPVIEDRLGVRVTASYRDYNGGVDNVFLGTKADPFREASINAAAYMTISERLTADLRFTYADSKAGSLSSEIVTTAAFDDFKPSQMVRNLDTFDDRRLINLSFKLELDLDDVIVTSITGYDDVDQALFGDGDFTSAPGVAQDLVTNVRAFTEELRIASNNNDRLHWLIGGFFQDRHTDNFLKIIPDNGDGTFGPGLIVDSMDVNKSKSWALFGQASYEVTDALELTVGLRYDEDKRSSHDLLIPASAAEKTFTSLQPKISLSYAVTPEWRFYATYAEGFRSGGFNAFISQADRSFAKESADSFEIGTKASLMDGRMTLSASVFDVSLDNQQFFFVTLNPPTQNVINIAKTKIRGVEFELAAQATDQLQLILGVGYIDAEIRDLDGSGALRGNRSPQTAKHSVRVGADYAQPLNDDYTLRLTANADWRGSIVWDAANAVRTPEKVVVDARLSLETASWALTAYARNIGDTRYPTQAITDLFGPGLHMRIPNSRRDYGIEAKVVF